MPEAVVETKLLPPRVRQRTVPRSRLDDLLSRGEETTLTLLAAPAGFGKTTLLGGWLVQRDAGRPVAWVALDDRDTDPAVFWTHVLHAVNRAAPGAATTALAALESHRLTIDDALVLFLNELGVIATDLTVVLDDYHLAESPAVRAGTVFLLEHLPPHVHLVISTRVDPALPLARLRARGELVEVRAADLRFTNEEAATYLNEVNALALDADDVTTLEIRTEGWAAALQLAALSLRGKSDPAAFIAGFAGDDRFVVDYLADEVLDRQPADIRAFLLDTAVLDELSAPLCDAVTRRTDSKAQLEHLERQNLFLVPLDDQRRKYRYHHLFADVLRAHLLEEDAERATELHRRASDWYHQAGDPERAVRHALAGGDLHLAADRIELATADLLRHRRESVLRRWAHDLPAELVRNRPVLAAAFISGLMSSNDFTGIEARIEHAENLLTSPREELVVTDEAALARVPATLETYRAALGLIRGKPEQAAHHAQRALARAAEDDHVSIASASAVGGLAAWADGELRAAHDAYRTAAEHLARAGHVADVLGCSIPLADIEIVQGRLRDARDTLERALALAEGAPMRGVPDVYVGLSRVAWERGDHSAAAAHLRMADEAGDANGLPQYPHRWRVMMARLRHAEGDAATALELLEEAERLYVGDFLPDVQPVAATRARLLAASGDIASAHAWAREHQVSPDDDLAYRREYEHLTLVRVLLAEHAVGGDAAALTRATALVARVLAAARQGHRTGVVVEALVLQARARHVAADSESAGTSLLEAVELAEPEGLRRPFLDEGPVLRTLLNDLGGPAQQDARARRLLDACPTWATANGPAPSGARAPDTGRADRGPGSQPTEQLVEPLSGRELEVLRLLASDLSGPDIARQLHVSLATVRTHTQHVYAKLAVNNRRAAVRRAHQLDLFHRARR